MPDYGLVARQINNLTNQIRSETASERADKLAMSNLGLQQAQLGLQQRTAQGKQDIALAKAKKEQWESEPVTGMQFLQTFPGMTPDLLKQRIDNIHRVLGRENANALLNAFTHKRSDWLGAIERASNAAKEESYRNKMLGLKNREVGLREKQGATPTQALTQMKVGAWQAYMQGKATPEQQALIGVDKDPYLSQAAQIVSNSDDVFGQPTEAIIKKVGEVADGLRQNRYQMPVEKEYLGNKIRMVYDPSTNKLVPK